WAVRSAWTGPRAPVDWRPGGVLPSAHPSFTSSIRWRISVYEYMAACIRWQAFARKHVAIRGRWEAMGVVARLEGGCGTWRNTSASRGGGGRPAGAGAGGPGWGGGGGGQG